MAPREIKSNAKWDKQKAALKKVQLTFELMQSVDKEVRLQAAREGESPSNVLRKILGLQVSAPQRPRLGVSLSSEEIQLLAKEYKIDPSDRKSLVRRATDAVQQYYLNKK